MKTKVFILFLAYFSSFWVFAWDESVSSTNNGVSWWDTYSYYTFSGCQDFENTLHQTLSHQNIWYNRWNLDDRTATPSAVVLNAEWDTTNKTSQKLSETNIQVSWIDEADVVKTDGLYLYVYNSQQNAIKILNAKNLDNIKSIQIPVNSSNINFYVTKNKLILTSTRYTWSNQYWNGWYDKTAKSIVNIYDISDKSKIVLTRTLQIEWILNESRLEDNWLMTMVISNSYYRPSPSYYTSEKKEVYSYNSQFLVPRMSDVQYQWTRRVNKNSTLNSCSDISSVISSNKSSPVSSSLSLTSILRLDTSIASGDIVRRTFLSEAGQIYVSRDSLYITSTLRNQDIHTSCPMNAKCAMPLIWNPGSGKTLIHRFALAGLNISYTYSRAITWNPLNQYSMDEDANKNFRIVTTEFSDTQSTRVSVLSSTGNILGTLSWIAPGENFQSSRFIGNRLYLVTFEQIDPLFVIDLSDAKNLKSLGELKIPGYSTYLHPYDANRLIGIGYDTKTNQWWGVQNAGVKVDLYNVSDVKNPRQEATLTLGDVGSSSDVLSNPRAFVYYKEKNLLLMPATLMTSAGDKDNLYLAKSAFQWLVGLSLEPGKITEKFRISHIEKSDTMNTDWKNTCKEYSYGYAPEYCKSSATLDVYLANNLWNYSSEFINRVLYVGENFYTIGDSKIQMQTFANPLNPIAKQVFEIKKNPSYPIPLAVQ